jgi:hypothetical protein
MWNVTSLSHRLFNRLTDVALVEAKMLRPVRGRRN